MNVTWTSEALSALESIVDYISKDSPKAASSFAEEVLVRIEKQLSANPKSGKPGRVDGTREFVVHSSYIAAYRVANEEVQVLTLRHTARLWPESF